ncbi:MAG: hypothetical protein OXI60_02735 [Acidiferrobacterales bacterium]|nr:hypothetical protein [Acidiferrobacterales bacterium]
MKHDALCSAQHTVPLMTQPTELQDYIFQLLDIDPAQCVAM